MIYTNLIRMPSSVRELVHETIDGDHVIFINENLSSDGQKEAYAHALDHIHQHDFDSDQSADSIEFDRHVI